MTFMLLFFTQLADIEKLLTHPIRPFIIGLIFIYWFFAVESERMGSLVSPCHAPS